MGNVVFLHSQNEGRERRIVQRIRRLLSCLKKCEKPM